MSLADRLSGEPKLSSSSNSRPALTGRAPAKAKQRAAPYVSKTRCANDPYRRLSDSLLGMQARSPPPASVSASISASVSASPAASIAVAGIDGNWEHDLFHASSNVYNPLTNLQAIDSPARSNAQPKGLFTKALRGLTQPNPSLRPFGNATPTISSGTGNTSSAITGGMEKSSSNDLFGRLDVNGRTYEQSLNAPPNSPADERRQRQKRLALVEEEAYQKDRQKKEAFATAKLNESKRRLGEEERIRREVLDETDLDRLASRSEEEEAQKKVIIERQRQQHAQSNQLGTLVIVQNLVDGTTPEDVKAAFADFGTIIQCRILSSNGDVLDMEVEFQERTDAQLAVSKLK